MLLVFQRHKSSALLSIAGGTDFIERFQPILSLPVIDPRRVEEIETGLRCDFRRLKVGDGLPHLGGLLFQSHCRGTPLFGQGLGFDKFGEEVDVFPIFLGRRRLLFLKLLHPALACGIQKLMIVLADGWRWNGGRLLGKSLENKRKKNAECCF